MQFLVKKAAFCLLLCRSSVGSGTALFIHPMGGSKQHCCPAVPIQGEDMGNFYFLSVWVHGPLGTAGLPNAS